MRGEYSKIMTVMSDISDDDKSTGERRDFFLGSAEHLLILRFIEHWLVYKIL